MSAAEIGLELSFEGHGVDEVAVVVVVKITNDGAPKVKLGDVIVKVDPRYFRPAEVEALLGDLSYAKEKLGWEPRITLNEMCVEMMQHDSGVAKQRTLLREHGHESFASIEL